MLITKLYKPLALAARTFSTDSTVKIRMVHINGQQSWDLEAKVG